MRLTRELISWPWVFFSGVCFGLSSGIGTLTLGVLCLVAAVVVRRWSEG